MKTNSDLKNDVQNALKWEPSLKTSKIGVAVDDGIVILTGTVEDYSQKSEAEDAAKNVAGVMAVVEEIEVKTITWGVTTDAEIAKEILRIFKWKFQVSNERVQIKVENGWVSLEGELAWNFQKEAVEAAVKHLTGVKGISNNIEIRSLTQDAVEEKDIQSALERNWALNDHDVDVKAAGSKITLTGTVSSLYQKEEAGKIAWKAPGVEKVVNDLVVDYDFAFND